MQIVGIVKFVTLFRVSLTGIVLSLVIWHSLIPMLNNTEELKMAKNGILFISNISKAYSYCLKASTLVQDILYIRVAQNGENLLPLLSKQINNVYSKASSDCSDLDIRLILRPLEAFKKLNTSHSVDLILYETELSKNIEKLKDLVPVKPEFKLQHIDIPLSQEDIKIDPVKTYEYVALGGTFDRLHNGHKILLSEAALRATKHLTVGVTDVNMIKSKKLWELIEPVEKRIKSVLEFLHDINPGIEYNVVPIQDVYGPTIDDPKYQLIVISEETTKGADKINEKRKERGLPLLETYTIGLAADQFPNRSEEEEEKVSSSNKRMRLLGTLLRPPMLNSKIPDWPYIIGLAGGIASGKSNIAEKLKAKGAGVVNCDIIAHDLYKPGLPLNSTISKTFGEDVIQDNGEVDRKKLGQIVFSDKNQLERLNQLIWPAVIEEAERRARALYVDGCRVVVMEAAVMVRAKWYDRCHQLWSVIIPPEEAVKRLQKRNGLTEEEARQRIDSQPSNSEQVAHANIVFSPFWSYEYTQSQIDKAWDHLQKYLSTRN